METEELEICKQATEDPESATRALTKSNLYLFLREFWECYSQDEFVDNWHIEQLANELELVARRVGNRENKLYDLIINIPPGTTKTALVSIFFPVWCWVNWFWMRFITSSHNWDLSLESAEYSRDIIRHEKFRKYFPEIDIRQDKDKKSNFRIVKKHFVRPGRVPRLEYGGGRISTSVGSKVTGFHAHIIIPDDLIDSKGAFSEADIRKANNHLDLALLTRKTDKRVTTLIMIMQRLAKDDPTGHFLKKKKANVRHLCLPGEITNGYDKFLKPKEWKKFYTNGLLDPVRLSRHELEEMEEDLGQYGYAGQVGQNPTPPGGGMFKTDKFLTVDNIPGKIVKTVRYWDKAGTKDGEGARTAGVKMSLLSDGRFLVHDSTKGRWESHDREDTIKRTAQGDGRRCKVYVEQEPGSGGKESAEGTIRNLAGYRVEAHRPTGDKVLRADPFSVQVNKGNVLLLRGKWIDDFVSEYEDFPLGKLKDQVDAGSGAFAALTGRIKKKVRVSKR